MAKRKTPKALAAVVITRHRLQIEHTEELLRVKRTVPVENQADHVKRLTEEQIVARMEGYNTCLEDAMHESNCYAGFHNYGPKQADGARYQVPPGSEDFLDWRRIYYTNGIA